ncbi:MAG: 2'-deoxycytidine 5'-triphosphate deaminase [SAR116 cluster bacterium]|jgi:dCTP deaminase|nr:2'-deoxycytidine 5'-triphosphate deaminase [SAR116 cluster bacterium]
MFVNESTKDGILPSQLIQKLIDNNIIFSNEKISSDSIQPASLDLRLGFKGWRVPASFLPGKNSSVEDKLKEFAMHEFSLSDGIVLECGCVYIVKLLEGLKLPKNISGLANPKSSTGRLDVFTRLIVDNSQEFETIPEGYSGPMYIEISPRTFSIVVRTGTRLNQLRFGLGNFSISDHKMKELQMKFGLVRNNEQNILSDKVENGLPLSVDLTGFDGLVGYKAKKHSMLIDCDKPKNYKADFFWEKIKSSDLITSNSNSTRSLVLSPDAFYILASKEFVSVPANLAAEMRPYDTRVGEFRAHYAGFFDPGFGLSELKAGKTKAVLEIRSHDVPFLIEDGQTICRLVFEPMVADPKELYGQTDGKNNYQSQGLKLSKHFIT